MGDRGFVDHSDEVKAALDDAIKAALEAVGNTAVSHAKNNLTAAGRVDHGNLRGSISHAVDPDENAVYIGTNTEYAIYNELGTGIYIPGGRQSPWAYKDESGEWHQTRGMRPTHFLKNAVQDHKNEYVNIIANEIVKRMK